MGTAMSKQFEPPYQMSQNIQLTMMMTLKIAAHQMRNLKKVPAPQNITIKTEKTGSPAGRAAPPLNIPAGSRVPVPSPWSCFHLAANVAALSIGRKSQLLGRNASPLSLPWSWAYLLFAGSHSSSPTACMESAVNRVRSLRHFSSSFSGLATATAH